MKCIYCDHPYTYLLKTGQRKCNRCKRKFSVRKLERQQKLWEAFWAQKSASETAREYTMHIATVLTHFERFRHHIAFICDEMYEQNSHLVTDYDEYLYLPVTLSPQKEIRKVKHFLTLAYSGKVYNLMMPSVDRLGLDPEDRHERKLIEKYLTFRTISKLSKERSTIRDFWDYFESFIRQYKGVSDEKFIYYLKEAEWRFNRFSPPDPKRLLHH